MEFRKKSHQIFKNTKCLKLIISKEKDPVLTPFADSDWARDKTDRKSNSGNLFKVGKTAIFWSTKKQNSVALSCAEVEYISVPTSAQETVWIRKLLKHLDLQQKVPIILYKDNQFYIKTTQIHKYCARTKHVDIKYHSIKHLKKYNRPRYCPS